MLKTEMDSNSIIYLEYFFFFWRTLNWSMMFLHWEHHDFQIPFPQIKVKIFEIAKVFKFIIDGWTIPLLN